MEIGESYEVCRLDISTSSLISRIFYMPFLFIFLNYGTKRNLLSDQKYLWSSPETRNSKLVSNTTLRQCWLLCIRLVIHSLINKQFISVGDQFIKKGAIGIPLTRLTPPHGCPKPGLGFLS